MKKLKKTEVKKTAFKALEIAALFVVAFAVEQLVGLILTGFEMAILEFALNEAGNAVIIKLLLKLALTIRKAKKL